MKRHILIFCMLAVFGVCRAMAGATMTVSEIYYNETYGYWGIDIGIENDGVPVNAFQCDVAKPGTFEFVNDQTNGFLYDFTGRALKPGGLGGGTLPTHSITMAMRPNGTLRVVVYSSDNTVFSGDSGAVLFLAMNKIGGTEAGDTPAMVNLTNQVLTYIVDDKVNSIYPDGIINDPFLTCYDSMGNNVVLFALGGYDTSDGIYTDLGFINNDLKTNDSVVSVNMLNIGGYSVGDFMLEPKNPNALIYTVSQDDFSNNVANKLYLENDVTGGLFWHSEGVVLDDEGLSFDFPYDAYAIGGSRADISFFSFIRDFPGGQWSTVMLPVSLSDEQLAGIKASGVEVARLDSYDAGQGTITYAEVEKFEANTPYLVRPSGSEAKNVFGIGVENVRLYPTDTLNVVRAGDISMHGNYEYTEISSTDKVWRYGYDAETGEFVKIGNNCKLGPFRCYLELPVSAQTVAFSRIRIAGATPTGIENIDTDAGAAAGLVYSVDGRRVSTDVKDLPAGVYVVNGRKVVVK
ncbi:hypothetical protein [Xylanibacter rodentium]|uniref:hypothetical protein n=1 Tax=Xylanibacter rodentium TaxID=2736289 RepID=UPI002577B944|nr:hypothetical protein [Xylanibacter rodentium]